MRRFYSEILGLSLIEDKNEYFKLAVGSSHLIFTSGVEGEPFYHFAFNIPSNKFREAKAWVKSKVELNHEDGKDEAHFTHLPAKSLYFYDPAGNIVEFISRQSVIKYDVAPFSQHSIINLSEISLTVDDPIKTGQELIELGIRERDNDELSERALNFMGDRSKESFLLLTKPGRRWIFSNKRSAVHPLSIKLSNHVEIEVKDSKEVVIGLRSK